MEEVEGLAFRVHGRVQGVGFRYFTQTTARRLGIRGWVKNEADGTVSGFAVAEVAPLQAFIQALHQGPPYSRVDQVETQTTVEPNPGPEFQVRR
ncbi:acylphosphatase [Acanthopleuribacter pedis]|uniref:acylphosphatase n=1 Tax=Acanthopleuribacter pedis TaxID=442870 RepID=A0A8J7Q5H4_9BACT|nr:acylphosphatase [Acanthopleuribacter pedis]MBO1316984.1 acylphosphatase [Acanthopleuribacter pedis]